MLFLAFASDVLISDVVGRTRVCRSYDVEYAASEYIQLRITELSGAMGRMDDKLES